MSEPTIARLQNEIVAQQALVCRQHATIQTLLEALEGLMNSIGGHEHWDSTMQGGVGCPICIKQRKGMSIARAAIAKAKGATK